MGRRILITSASGRTSGYVLRALLSRPSSAQVRLLVRSKAAVSSLISTYPSLTESSFVIADYLDYSSLLHAMKDVDVVFYNPSQFHPNETGQGINVIGAAKELGAKHFVYCSVLYPFLSKMPHHKAKLGVEEYLTESGLEYTILQPTSFMQNIPLPAILRSSSSPMKLPCMYNTKTLQGFLHLDDFASVAVSILMEPEKHRLATYQLIGENCTLEELAQTLERESGKHAICEMVDRQSSLQEREKSSGSWSAELAEMMLLHYDRRGIPGNTNVTRWLLGRDTITWKDWIHEVLGVLDES
ncbi:NAD(P)-binding protein [Neolentinus lepideus HHB14362 ss-1]|uniref:NAD(P)-binding protein n=1 Tax=Neolentinus lepideus HHB14362 ss-1 TaxID=1314782 RepID=A0A165S7X4_9AGAM|nr:NAD(P)-binding protein [Neolentinus lepideus HHB14362 ss-1]